jgi:hypothetical protein
VFANLQKEFAESPVKTIGSALAIIVTVCTFGWAIVRLIPGVLPEDAPTWTPVYFLGAALGVGFGLISLASFRLGGFVGCGASVLVLYFLADMLAWLIVLAKPMVGTSDLWLTGIAAFLAYWVVLLQTAVDVARSGKYNDFGVVVFLISVVVVPASAFAFAAIVSLNLPSDMQFFTVVLE